MRTAKLTQTCANQGDAKHRLQAPITSGSANGVIIEATSTIHSKEDYDQDISFAYQRNLARLKCERRKILDRVASREDPEI